ncbi:MAG: hypothetical protein K6G12_11775 [Lachnospiraceae bacterium]|nr:hypothetical protein [Lachnospiraceae bacterium]
MDKEKQFSDMLAGLIEQGRENDNFLESSVVDAACSEYGLDDSKLDLVYDYLKKNHIGVGEPLKDSDYLESEEINYLNMYLEELKALPSFSEGEKEAVTLSAMAGDTDAQSRLIEMHLMNVVEIAKLYAGQGAFIEDLIGEGNIALSVGVTMLGALEHQSEADGMLAHMIMEGMEEYLDEFSKQNAQDEKNLKSVNEVADKARELYEELRRKVTIEELMLETGLSKNAIQRAITFSGDKIEYIDTTGLSSGGE